MARPSSRTKRHDKFEATHRFCGWAVLVLVWVNTIVFTTSRAHGSAVSALFSAPTFWLLVLTTCGAVWPWLLLRRVPLTVERPSSHVAVLHLDQDLEPAVGTTRAISRSRLYGWHPFANIPVAIGSDDRGYRMTVSRAGDWTAELIDDPPGHVWVRGIPTVGVINVKNLFSKVVIVVDRQRHRACARASARRSDTFTARLGDPRSDRDLRRRAGRRDPHRPARSDHLEHRSNSEGPTCSASPTAPTSSPAPRP